MTPARPTTTWSPKESRSRRNPPNSPTGSTSAYETHSATASGSTSPPRSQRKFPGLPDLGNKSFASERLAEVLALQVVRAVQHLGAVQESGHDNHRNSRMLHACPNSTDEIPPVTIRKADVDDQHIDAPQ